MYQTDLDRLGCASSSHLFHFHRFHFHSNQKIAIASGVDLKSGVLNGTCIIHTITETFV